MDPTDNVTNNPIDHLIGVVDGDLESPEDLPGRGVLEHGDLEAVLGARLPVEGGGVVVEVHHSDRHRGDVVVHGPLAPALLDGLSGGEKKVLESCTLLRG